MSFSEHSYDYGFNNPLKTSDQLVKTMQNQRKKNNNTHKRTDEANDNNNNGSSMVSTHAIFTRR